MRARTHGHGETAVHALCDVSLTVRAGELVAVMSPSGSGRYTLTRSKVDRGAAGVLVTHEARHAAWVDRVVLLRDGVVVHTSGPLANPGRRANRSTLAKRKRTAGLTEVGS